MVCVSGECEIILDNGRIRENVILNDPRKGILIGNYLWREIISFSTQCVLLVFADQHFDESDYIRDYGTFLDFVSKV